jgi:hypothetical protein
MEKRGAVHALIKSGITCLPEILCASRKKVESILSSPISKHNPSSSSQSSKAPLASVPLLSKQEINELFSAVDSLPIIEMSYKINMATLEGDCLESKLVTVEVDLQRRGNSSDVVYAPNFPKKLRELWWIVIGDPQSGELFAVKRINLERRNVVTTLRFDAPIDPGEYSYHLYLMSGTYLGLDQQQVFAVTI